MEDVIEPGKAMTTDKLVLNRVLRVELVKLTNELITTLYVRDQDTQGATLIIIILKTSFKSHGFECMKLLIVALRKRYWWGSFHTHTWP